MNGVILESRLVGASIDAAEARGQGAVPRALWRRRPQRFPRASFLAKMSHEIRSPMNAILGMLQPLQTTALFARQADSAAKAASAAQALLRLLNDSLDFSKVDAGKIELERAPFDPDVMLRDISGILSVSVGTKPVEPAASAAPAWLGDQSAPCFAHGRGVARRQQLGGRYPLLGSCLVSTAAKSRRAAQQGTRHRAPTRLRALCRSSRFDSGTVRGRRRA
jgi:signal transduction histidine kinase